ncbi:MAG TPA: Tm-1-like ATP-binding domain-containing protein [Candidatus Limnocylindrales bacterium]
MSKNVLLIGTLDTKGREYAYVRDLIEARGLRTFVLDAGVLGEPTFTPNSPASRTAQAAGGSLAELREKRDRGYALEVMGRGARALAAELVAAGDIDAVFAMGGSGGTSIGSTAMQALPVGLPKLIVSTMASGNVAPYVDVKDITMMYSVVDVAGLNRVSRRVFANAAGAISGMAEQDLPNVQQKPLVAATMFGVTTPCVDRMRARIEDAGYEMLVFHAVGSGGRSMESLIADGFVAGVADVTTTEWCDELVGGVLSAGPDRLDAAARTGVPQVVSVGALDMVNLGPRDTVPEQFRDRNIYVHNPQVTLMRTTPGECKRLGEIIAGKLNRTTGPTAFFIPLKGVSMIDAEGMPFHDPAADAALFGALRKDLDRAKVELVELDMHINDPAFADAMADRLLAMLEQSRPAATQAEPALAGSER